LQERTEFFATLSHEFRTPLAIIRTQAGLLADPEVRQDAAASTTSLQIVGEAATQALEIVNDILEASRSDAEAVDLEFAPVDVAGLVREMSPTIEGLATAAGLHADIHVDALPEVSGDARRLRQVLLNLVDNAVKYTPKGGNVTVMARRAGAVVEIIVQDTGIGIPPESLTQLFEPFYRVPGSKPLHGESTSGIGLTLAKRLVEGHGGRLVVQSEPGNGSAFTVELPATSPARGRRRKQTAGALAPG
jgi:two-component system phosphate regulon sensor histidine kinase PhoR